MTGNLKARFFCLLVGVTAGASGVRAQANPDSIHHRNDCRLAAQTLSTGNPAPKMQWALQVIPSCGDQGVVGTSIAAALTRLRSSSDTGQLLPLKTATFGFVDGSVYSAALAISADASASPTARTVNLLILLMQLRPTLDVTWADLLSATLSETERCPSGLLNDLRVGVGPMPLPADATTQASTLANSVQSNASLPTMVRVAARCVVEGVRN